jgi:hypothetical protein
MTLYQAADGTIYGGDRQIRSDGTFDPEAPDRPSPQHVWDGSQWVAPAAVPHWGALYDRLRGSDLFAKAFSTSQTNALALLLSTLNSNAPAADAGRLADFDFAIMVIRLGLAEDFTLEQVDRFNQLLLECDFPFLVNDGSLQAANQVRVGNENLAS